MSNWTLLRQPKDQIVDHEFSIWCDENPIILANEMPGEDGALAFIVDVMNIHEKMKTSASGEASGLPDDRSAADANATSSVNQ